MSYAGLLSEKVTLIGVVNPQTVANVEKLSTVIDMSIWHEVFAVAALGDMAAETIDFKCYTCDSDGSNAAALTSATQRAAHATNNDNKQIQINLKAEHITAGKRYIKFGLVTGGATGGPACVLVFGLPRFKPGSDDKISSLVEIKT